LAIEEPPEDVEAEWFSRGLVSANECFRCTQMAGHRHEGRRTLVLCRGPCKFEPEAELKSP